MEQNDFVAILRRYLSGNATPSEKNLVEAWYASLKNNVSDQDIPSDAALEKYYRKTISAHIRRSRHKGNVRKYLSWYATGIAASLFISIFTYFFFVTDSVNGKIISNKTSTSIDWKYTANATQLQQIILLPDSSKVILQPESTLKYASVFNKTQREVYLEGEASFEVTHNATLPFLVYANEVTTKVLGTSFEIRALKNEQKVTVVVKTGRVSVYTNAKRRKPSHAADEIILTPNQKIIYDKKHDEISKTLVEKPRIILPKEEVKRMRFEEAPVTEIFKALEKAYGVEIEFDEDIFSACELTTVISDDDIYSRLDIICNALGTSYILTEDRVVISSSGCKAKIY